MQNIPLVPFEELDPTTITGTLPLPEISSLNLKAIFLLLPLSKYAIHNKSTLKAKQDKLIYPLEYNVPGEILSLRYGSYTRGIKRTSRKAFPTSITIDIGTSVRILSIKFSQTIKLTGAPNFNVIDEAVGYLLEKISQADANIKYIQDHKNIALQVREKFFDPNVSYTEEEKYIYNLLHNMTVDLEETEKANFLDTFILAFDDRLYEGNLVAGECQSEMINIPFELGFTVNQQAMAEIMNVAPFECPYNNVRTSTTIMVVYRTTKTDRYGKVIPAKHNFRINKSGYITYSGNSIKEMRNVYYTFICRILENLPYIQSIEEYPRKVKIKPNFRVYSVDEWLKTIRDQYYFQQSILEGYLSVG